MKITEDTVRHLCDLAALRLGPEEVKRMRRDLERILEYVEQLSGIDTREVPPTAHVLDIPTPTREDGPGTALPVEEALRNAPQESRHSFVVPKVIE
jgi:aspartyl-tRNA(Asn)/glutamyl-tRNA(Gln) amidotransferase subunit C